MSTQSAEKIFDELAEINLSRGGRYASHGEMQERADRPDTLTVIGIVGPPSRIGVCLFAVEAEYALYKPGSAANGFFQMIGICWENFIWNVMYFPLCDKEILSEMARKIGLRFSNGIPQIVQLAPNVTVIGAHRQPLAPEAKVFPCNGPEVFTLEYTKENSGGGKLLTKSQEQERMDDIWRRNGALDVIEKRRQEARTRRGVA